jgi:glycosyltransferase involved in cell wall biosynthesis
MSKLNSNNLPLVSIGIPTYNRAMLLTRAIESALNQNYENVEVIVSDNASSDDTESICRRYSENDSRLKYIRQSSNRGPAANFTEVLKSASGQYFMWLGDDDWIDLNYVSVCVRHMISNSTMALVYGTTHYYRNGQKTHDGNVFSLLHDKWWQRVLAYYAAVTDNGMFYGVMQTAYMRNIGMQNIMGGDWLMLANVVSLGKAKAIPETAVHRELGGATASYQHIANSVGLPKIQATYPMLTIAINAFWDIVAKGYAFKSRPHLLRGMVAVMVLPVILFKYRAWWITTIGTHLNRLLLRNI